MTTKTKINESSPLETIKVTAARITDELFTLDIEKVQPSPLEPQIKRRAHFNQDKILELSESIKKHTLINAITVRPVNSHFEIIAGERRWLASKLAGLLEIRAVIRNLTDEQTEEIQLTENLDREDLHPLDEAYWYKFLMAKPNATIADVALKVGKSKERVHQLLKLNDLIQDAQDDLSDNLIPLGHALEIAKYPRDIQPEILSHCYKSNKKADGVDSFQSLKSRIERDILKVFKNAPFSIKSKELRADGLACVDCPERAGYSPTLFGNEFKGKNDNCLNKKCWNAKIQTHIQITRQALADEIKKPLNHVPIITDDWYLQSYEKPEGKYIERDDFKVVDASKPCDKSKMAVYFHGNKLGKTALICPKSSSCEVHWKSSGNSSSYQGSTVTPEDRLKRKEELFFMRVGEPVRRKVLQQCAEKFGAGYMEKSITEQALSNDLLLVTLCRLWFLQASNDDKTEGVIGEIIANWTEKKVPSANRWDSASTGTEVNRFLSKLDVSIYPRILFLFIHGYKGAMFYDNYNSQKEIAALAKQFDVNYQLIDAQERLAQAPMKHKSLFRDYLAQIEAGEKTAKIPRMHSDKWIPKD